MTAPQIVITMGDPAGIGPEVVLKALADPRVAGRARPLLIGDHAWLERSARASDLDLDLVRVESPETHVDGVAVLHSVDVAADLPIGVPTAAGGHAAYACLARAVEVCTELKLGTMVTAPLNKVALEAAGHGHDGHTELLQTLTRSPWSLTVFVLPDLRVLYLTRHLSLREAIDAVTADRIVTVLERFASESVRIGLRRPRIAVAALNPHASEGGLFGNEEAEHIEPGVHAARALGLDVAGPIPADSVFHQARRGAYDIVLCLYHDQAASVTKSIDFDATVSVTLGLPFVRLSVDHGTAFDIAGRNAADATNMVNTMVAAIAMANATSEVAGAR